MIGSIVCSVAGRDKGKFLVVVGITGDDLLVCDGKERPLDRPKRKRKKHVAATGAVLEKEQYLTDKSLRRALAVHRCAPATQKEEKVCQNQI